MSWMDTIINTIDDYVIPDSFFDGTTSDSFSGLWNDMFSDFNWGDISIDDVIPGDWDWSQDWDISDIWSGEGAESGGEWGWLGDILSGGGLLYDEGDDSLWGYIEDLFGMGDDDTDTPPTTGGTTPPTDTDTSNPLENLIRGIFGSWAGTPGAGPDGIPGNADDTAATGGTGILGVLRNILGQGGAATSGNNAALTTLLAALINNHEAGNSVEDMKELIELSASYSDPFHPKRAFFGDELVKLYNDPSSLNDSAAYNFRFNEGQRATERAQVAAGNRYSGNILTALQDYGQRAASQEYDNQWNRLAGASGATSGQMGQAGASTSSLGQGAIDAGIYQRGSAWNDLLKLM